MNKKTNKPAENADKLTEMSDDQLEQVTGGSFIKPVLPNQGGNLIQTDTFPRDNHKNGGLDPYSDVLLNPSRTYRK